MLKIRKELNLAAKAENKKMLAGAFLCGCLLEPGQGRN